MRVFVGLVAALSLCAPFSTVHARPVQFNRDDLECLVQHEKAYLRGTSDPIVLVPGGCPSQTLNIRAMGARATSSSNVVIERNPASMITVLSKVELRCLIEAYRTMRRKESMPTVVRWETTDCKG